MNVDGVGGSFYAIFYITVMFLFLLKTMWHRFLLESGIEFLGSTLSCKSNDIHRFVFSKIVLNFEIFDVGFRVYDFKVAFSIKILGFTTSKSRFRFFRV